MDDRPQSERNEEPSSDVQGHHEDLESTPPGDDATSWGEPDNGDDLNQPGQASDGGDPAEGSNRSTSGTVLPHWTEPATGEVPKIFARESTDDDPLAAWSTLASAQPRWRDQASDWDDDELSILAEGLPSIEPHGDPGEARMYSFDDLAEGEPTAVTGDENYETSPQYDEYYATETAYRGDEYADYGDYGDYADAPSSGRNMGQAVGVGVALAAVALGAFYMGPKYAMALVAVVLVFAAMEFFAAIREAGYRPPALVGVAAAAFIPLAAYWQGEAGVVVALTLTLWVGLLWYLTDVGGEHVVPNLGVTLLGVIYVGVFGSFAALLLRAPHGIGLLAAAIIGTVAHDVAGLFVGRAMGRSPLSAASPNKTVEGTIGAMVAALVATVVITGRIHPFNSFGHVLVLGLVIAVVAPLGDLCESRLKRDLGIKDMGSILPGHGGLLDRFDALLFVLPATYYVARILL